MIHRNLATVSSVNLTMRSDTSVIEQEMHLLDSYTNKNIHGTDQTANVGQIVISEVQQRHLISHGRWQLQLDMIERCISNTTGFCRLMTRKIDQNTPFASAFPLKPPLLRRWWCRATESGSRLLPVQ